MKEKAFFITFIELSLNQIKQVSLEGESPTLRKSEWGVQNGLITQNKV